MQWEEFKTAAVGQWQGTKNLYLEPPTALTSPSHLAVRPVAGGSFLQFDYDWIYEGETQSGVLLFGFSDASNVANAAWVDSFHMSSGIFSCTGTALDRSARLLGSYPAPPDPDWGWRITLHSVSADALQIVMHNISPAGQEDLAVQADFTRRSS